MVDSPSTLFSAYVLISHEGSRLTPWVFSQQKKLYKIHNLTDEESTLLEPAACAIHGLDKLNPGVGIEVLLLGAGPTGLILAQLLKQNGAARIVIAANKGIKMDIAKDLNAGDEYIELDRQNPDAQWKKLKEDNPYGFDVVVEATGVEKLANDSINYVRRGGTLMIYGVYENKALVHWPPSKVSTTVYGPSSLSFKCVCGCRSLVMRLGFVIPLML
jgi:D-arabinitol dehydrogenase (NADP+)